MTDWADRTEYQRQRARLLFACIAARSTLRSLAVARRHGDETRALLREEVMAHQRINLARRKMAALRALQAEEATSRAPRPAEPLDRDLGPDKGLPCPMCDRGLSNAWDLEEHMRYSCPVRNEKAGR